MFKYSATQMKQLRVKHGKEAKNREQQKTAEKNQVRREREKRLLILQQKQEEIVRKSPAKPFKPTPDMIENAFQ